MAGHSKWHNIQHRKGAQDKKRGKIFTKLIHEITIASKLGGPDSNANPRLRSAIDKALNANMTKDTISRAVKRGSGEDGGAEMQEIRYEGYGPCGVALIIDCLSDNKNRSVAEVRHALSKAGGNLGTSGSVSYLFNPVGLIHFNQGDEEQLMEIALENGADDMEQNDDGSFDVITAPEQLFAVNQALKDQGLISDDAVLSQIATTDVAITTLDDAEKIIRLHDTLEDLDDVQNVYSNANIDDALLEQLNN